jgi:hypothetical protein
MMTNDFSSSVLRGLYIARFMRLNIRETELDEAFELYNLKMDKHNTYWKTFYRPWHHAEEQKSSMQIFRLNADFQKQINHVYSFYDNCFNISLDLFGLGSIPFWILQ